MNRKNGVSILIPTQNEEAMVGLCILSFLDFGDELIVVDNGSSDHTKEIIEDLVVRYPKKIKYFDVPELPDLFQNRQYALEKSSYKWIVRADSDYVAYTEGENNILQFRESLISQKKVNLSPRVYAVPQPNVTGDFWHTGYERDKDLGLEQPGRYVPPPYSTAHMLRIYEYYPGFEFQRLGRWEGVKNQDLLSQNKILINHPLWMHCNIKSNINYLYRSERTNWREKGDYTHYPTLYSYLLDILPKRYGTTDFELAATIYFDTCIMPFLQIYDPVLIQPYPKAVQQQMKKNAIYKIVKHECGYHRKFLGLHNFNCLQEEYHDSA
jgi:glycosyltransferase involved in cell wall biosynthesis